MKRVYYLNFVLPLLVLTLSACSDDEDDVCRAWNDTTLSMQERLRSLPDVDSAEVDTTTAFPGGAFRLMFRLPVDHNDASKGTFLNKVYVGIQNIDSLNTVYLEGYYGNALPTSVGVQEILNSNLISIEHRDFGESLTNTDYAYLTTAQAAADQNQILNDLQLLLKRRCAITGASKGGITTTLLAGYYPQRDAVYFPVSAPFCRSTDDKAGHQFTLNTVGTPEQRQKILQTQRRLLALVKDPEVMALYRKYLEYCETDFDHMDTPVEDLYYYGIQEYGTMLWQYYDYRDSFIPADSLEGLSLWKFLRTSRLFSAVAGVAYSANSAYWVQAARELGAYGYNDNLSDIYQPTVKPFCKAILPTRFRNETYSGDTFSRYVDQAVKTTSLPMMFLYGADDPWTAWVIDDALVNGSNVRKYVIPGGNHTIDFDSDLIPAAQREEIKSWILRYMYRHNK